MKTVVLAAGDFPSCGSPGWNALEAADRIVCCDGAADILLERTGRVPDAVVGDLDSLKGKFSGVVRIPEQETNDLEKAVRYCREKGWDGIVVVGATGKREDHSIGNVFRALDLGVELATDHGTFYPVDGVRVFETERGAAVSIFAPDPQTVASSKGLEWPLDGVEFRNLYCATLNRAASPRVEITVSRPVLVFISRSSP